MTTEKSRKIAVRQRMAETGEPYSVARQEVLAELDTARQSSGHWSPADSDRAADSDRDAVAERLRNAVAEGRIDLEELDERLDLTFSAKTYGQLRALVVDLPVHTAPAPARGAINEPETLVLKTTTPNLKQSGPWVVPQRITAETTTGFITIDFTQATCTHREVTVQAVCRTGWIRVIVPEGWAVHISPSSTNTSHITNKAPDTADPGFPTVVMTAHPIFGYVKIKQQRRKR